VLAGFINLLGLISGLDVVGQFEKMKIVLVLVACFVILSDAAIMQKVILTDATSKVTT